MDRYLNQPNNHFEICLAAPDEVMVVFCLMESIALNTPRFLHFASKCSMLPILTLRDSQIHIGSLDCSNATTNVEASINEHFGVQTTLKFPDVNLYYSHVRIRKNFDNLWFRHNIDVVEDISGSNNCFDHTSINRHIYAFYEVCYGVLGY